MQLHPANAAHRLTDAMLLAREHGLSMLSIKAWTVKHRRLPNFAGILQANMSGHCISRAHAHHMHRTEVPRPATFLHRKKTSTIITPLTLYAVVRDMPALCKNQRAYTKGVDNSHSRNMAPA